MDNWRVKENLEAFGEIKRTFRGIPDFSLNSMRVTIFL
jgi:hypothetical protein